MGLSRFEESGDAQELVVRAAAALVTLAMLTGAKKNVGGRDTDATPSVFGPHSLLIRPQISL